MDYHAIHGHDVASFDPSPSSHRMRTVSAAHVGDDADEDKRPQYLSTGLANLDKLLGDGGLGVRGEGVRQGQVTEIWGPSGAGKSALGIQLVAGVLNEGKPAVWVDCLQPVCIERLGAVVTARLDAATETGGDALDRLVHYTCPTLPHFIALLCRSTDSCIPPEAPLVVVDGLSGLLNHSLPRIQPQGSAKAAGKGPSLGARRLQILQYIVTALKKLAVNRGIAIVILSQCATKMQAEGRATLLPAVNAGVWEQGIPNRVVLYRDFVTQHDKTTALHFAAVEKKNGQASSMSALFGEAATFDVQPTGLVEASFDSRPADIARPKRKLDETDFEAADPDEEDYGWQDDSTEPLPPLPSQWHGSEDQVVGPPPQDDDESKDEPERGRDPNDEIPASDEDEG